MRDLPPRIHRIAVKTACGLVVNAAIDDRFKRVGRRVEQVGAPVFLRLAQQEQENRLLREFRRIAKPAIDQIILLHDLVRCLGENRRRDLLRLHAARHDRVDLLRHAVGIVFQLALLTQPEAGGLDQKRPEIVGRKVSATVERLELRRHEHGVGPSATPRNELRRQHVCLVDIRAALPIDLDRHEA